MTTAVAVRRLLCIWHAVPFVALAEEPPSSLDRVVVTATRSERTSADVPASVTIIARDEIAATPAQAVDEVLRVAGVEMTLVSSYQAHPTSALISCAA